MVVPLRPQSECKITLIFFNVGFPYRIVPQNNGNIDNKLLRKKYAW